MVAEAEQVADDMFRFPFQLAFAVAFGESGYGLPVAGLPETLASISAADTRDWHARAFVGVRPVVIAVGDVDPDRASDTLAGVFADAPPRSAVGELARSAGWPARARAIRHRSVVTRDKAQAAIAMAFPGMARRDPDRAAVQVWAAVASGLGGRLFEALRDRRSLAYTVVASAWLKARAGAIVTYIATSPDREDEAREEMLRELGRFAREPVSETELQPGGELPRRPGRGESAERCCGAGRDPGGVGGRLGIGGAPRSGGRLPRRLRGGRSARRAALARPSPPGGRRGARHRRCQDAGRRALERRSTDRC